MHLVMLSHTTSLSLTGFLGNSRHLSHKASPCQGLGPVPGSQAVQWHSHLECGQVTMFISSLPMLMGGEVGFTPGPTGMAQHLPTSQAGCEFMADSHTPELPSSGLLRPASPVCGQPHEHRLSSTWLFRALWGSRAQSGGWAAKSGPLQVLANSRGSTSEQMLVNERLTG